MQPALHWQPLAQVIPLAASPWMAQAMSRILPRTARWRSSPLTPPLGTAITDLSGNALAANCSWSFTTVDGAWGNPILIETNNAGNAVTPQIAIDSNGNALAVWYQFDGTHFNIWANRFE